MSIVVEKWVGNLESRNVWLVLWYIYWPFEIWNMEQKLASS